MYLFVDLITYGVMTVTNNDNPIPQKKPKRNKRSKIFSYMTINILLLEPRS